MRSLWTVVVVFALVAVACSDDDVGSTTALSTTTNGTVAPSTAGGDPATTTPVTGTGSTTTPATTTTTVGSSTTTLPAVPLTEFEIDVELVADGFEQPVFVTTRPGDTRLFVVEQGGRITALDVESGERTLVLDIEDRVRWSGEQGLLGIAFHPTDTARLVVHYSDNDGATVIEEYPVDPSTGIADREAPRRLLTRSQPAGNHNGGMIDFGPDGYLYVSLGDGGASNDRFDNGQDPFTVLGAIIRIDLDSGDPYAIPADNPFADGQDGVPELWAWGLRNPWRFAFDGTDLWVGDVGQGTWEEIDLFDTNRPGDNAGWPLLEGNHCFRFAECDPSAFLSPVTEYRHEGGRCSVTGGVVYRGRTVSELLGTYLFGDYCTGEIWGLRVDGAVEQRLFTDGGRAHLSALPGLTSFGTGPDGEAYVLQANGSVWRITGSE